MLYNLFLRCLNISYQQVGCSANYAVQKDGATLYIFFQDSDGLNDWKINLDFPARPYKRMGKTVWLAHRGFLKLWKETKPLLKTYILDKKYKKIIITGYSHGAAVGMLCHEYAWYHRPDIRNSIAGFGFGCPRVYWGIKSLSVSDRWRSFCVIRNTEDIVTHLPPRFLGYSHVGRIIKIGERGKYSSLEAHYAKNILKELSLKKL